MTESGGARVRRVRERLGSRDLAVLHDLARFRRLTTVQVQRLHVADGSLLTQGRRARALMHKLTSLHLVVRLPRRVGGVRAGSAGQVYGLSGLGEAVLDLSGPYGKRRRGAWATKSSHQHHVLAVSELYVQLVEIARSGTTIDLLCFEAEPTCWRRLVGVGGEALVLKPDGFARVGIGDFELAWFIEVDLGTESLPTVRRKCDAYIRYWRSGSEQHQRGVFPRVLWLVPTERRLAGLHTVFRRLAHETQALFSAGLLTHGAQLLTTLPETGGVT